MSIAFKAFEVMPLGTMVIAKCCLFFCVLLFSCAVMAQNYSIVYVPDHLMYDVYTALGNIPGIRFGSEILNDRHWERDTVQQEEIDMNYYDDHDYKRYGKLPIDSKQFVRVFYQPSLPMPLAASVKKHPSRKNNFLIQGRLSTVKRSARSVSHAGYTDNLDTCKLYNHNLIKVWTKLAKYIDTENQQVPNKMALHNIALIIKAYLDHQTIDEDENDKGSTETLGTVAPEANVGEMLRTIKQIVSDAVDEESTNRIVDLIVANSTSTHGRGGDVECIINNKENLNSYVNLAFQKYLDDSYCRRAINLNVDISINKNRRIRQAIPPLKDIVGKNKKMNLYDAKNFLRQWQNKEVENCQTNARDQFLEAMKLIIRRYIEGLACRS